MPILDRMICMFVQFIYKVTDQLWFIWGKTIRKCIVVPYYAPFFQKRVLLSIFRPVFLQKNRAGCFICRLWSNVHINQLKIPTNWSRRHINRARKGGSKVERGDWNVADRGFAHVWYINTLSRIILTTPLFNVKKIDRLCKHNFTI